MLKFFFPLSGLHFSRLCNNIKNECHCFVIRFLRAFLREKPLVANHFFTTPLHGFLIEGLKNFCMKEEFLPIRLAIFASGKGSNAREIIRYFHEAENLVSGHRVRISLIVCNKPEAGVLGIAESTGIPALLIEKEKFFRGSHYLEEFKAHGINFIVLAGFLWKLPVELIRTYPDRILNIHPALLPKYGGKGMYGSAVHEAVIAAHEQRSGITIHYVDELYDHGKIFFQASCSLSPDETPATLAEKIHALEYRHFPEQIARWLQSKLSLNP
jgi:phosphoribosylglycinamide formyltransferase 1